MVFHKPYYHNTVLRECILNIFAASPLVPRHLRTIIYRICGLKIRTVRISSGCRVGRNLEIGNSFVNLNCFFDTHAKITIGDQVDIGQNVQFITSDHELGSEMRRAGKQLARPITVGNGAWIGAGAMIRPGVKIGEGCVIAMGSVVIRDCESNTLYAGNPAVAKRQLPTG